MDTKTATFLIALFLIQSSSANPQESIPTPVLECMEKEGVTKEAADSILYGGNLTLAENDPNLKCFAHCMLEKDKLMDGCELLFVDRQSEGTKHIFSVIKAMEFCKDAVKSTERCECGFELAKCIRSNFDKTMEEKKSNNESPLV